MYTINYTTIKCALGKKRGLKGGYLGLKGDSVHIDKDLISIDRDT